MKTNDVIESMLTENTGRHFLDSGSAYGRHWEQNQGRNFDNEPQTNLTVYRDGDFHVTVNVYHYLTGHLEYIEDKDERFQQFLKDHPDKSHIDAMNEFAENVENGAGLFGEGKPMRVNTYNHESVLSQTLQYVFWEGDDGAWIALQIHGGCDVRGGYTRPRIFAVHHPEYFISADREVRAGCTGEGAHHWYSDDAGYHWYENGSSAGNNLESFEAVDVSESGYESDSVRPYDPEAGKVFCPKCPELKELNFMGTTQV
jgi:hypothetical protein